MISCQDFPETVEEFMEEYKMVDTKEVYSNGTEFVPIFRMKQWFEHEKKVSSAKPNTGKWVKAESMQYFRKHYPAYTCSICGFRKGGKWNYCPNCGAKMEIGHETD